MINGFVWLERGVQAADTARLEELAKKDKHGVFFPSFTIRKAGKLAGWVSINGVPFVFAHLATEPLQPRDSFSVINSVENHVALGGAQGIVWPIPKHSPFHPLMESMGYQGIGEYELFFKKL